MTVTEFWFQRFPTGHPLTVDAFLTREDIHGTIATMPRRDRPAGTLAGRPVKLNKCQFDRLLDLLCFAYVPYEFNWDAEEMSVWDLVKIRRGGEWVPLFSEASGLGIARMLEQAQAQWNYIGNVPEMEGV